MYSTIYILFACVCVCACVRACVCVRVLLCICAGKRMTMLRYRRLQIAAMLIDLPPTKHMLESFTVDLLSSSVSGM